MASIGNIHGGGVPEDKGGRCWDGMDLAAILIFLSNFEIIVNCLPEQM